MADDLTWDATDKHQSQSKRHLIGTVWTNTRNGHAYKIVGMYWEADTGEWMIAYRRCGEEDPVPFVRRDVSFFGINRNSQPRFIQNECKSSS